MNPRQSRGYRNKNPGNIDWSERNKWQGQVGREQSGNPPRFAVFESHEYGIRALAMLLTTYQDRHGLRTIRGIVNRWAPPTENNTGSYVDFVDRFLPNHGPDDRLDLHTYADMRLLVEAIIRKELGGNPYDSATIDAGLRLAGLTPGRVSATGTARAAAGTAAAGVGAVAVVQPLAEAVAQAAPALSVLNGLAPWLAVLVIVAAAGFFIWQRSRRAA